MKPGFILSANLLLVVCLTSGAGCTRDDGANPSAPTTKAADQSTSTPLGSSSASASTLAKPAPDATKTADESPASGEIPVAANVQKSSEECQQLLGKIRALSNNIPRLFQELTRPIDAINSDMLQCMELCETFLGSCQALPSGMCEVQAILARQLLARVEWFRRELRKNKKPENERKAAEQAYIDRLRGLSESALSCVSLSDQLKADTHRVLVELEERAGKYDKARQHADEILTKYPSFDLIANMRFKKTRSYLNSYDYEGALKYVETLRKDHSDDDEMVLYNIAYFEALKGLADLKGMEALMTEILAEYPLRLKSIEPKWLARQYTQWFYIAHFWIGFSRMAGGDVEGARSAFLEHKAQVESLRAKQQAKNQNLDPVIEVTHTHRTLDLLEFLDDFYGKTPPYDLNFGEFWMTKNTLSLKKSLGQVVILMFRKPNDPRSVEFLKEIDRLVKELGDDGLQGAVCAYLLGRPNPERDSQKLQAFRDELAALQIDLPGGFDPDREAQSFFRSVHGTVGTASCVVIDRQGRIAYFMADPKTANKALIRSVVQRLLDSD